MIPPGQPVIRLICKIHTVYSNTDNYLHRRNQTIHVVSSVTIVTKKQFVVVLRGSAQGAGLALDALPGVFLHADQHVGCELETRWVAWK